MSVPLYLIPKNFNPENPIPNDPFYSPPALYSQGPWFPFIVGTGFTFNYQTSTISATGGGGGGTPATPTVEGIVYGCTQNSGAYNTALGFNSLGTPAAGAVANVALGVCALSALGTGLGNTAVGAGSSASVSSGELNVGVGFNSLFALTTGCNNIGIGINAGLALTTERNNVIIGGNAGAPGENNQIYISDGAGTLRVKINECGAISFDGVNYGTAGQVLCSGGPNTTWGWSSGAGTPAATPTTLGTVKGCVIAGVAAIGCNVLLASTGSANSALGDSALTANTSGSYNTALGENSLGGNTTGNFNVAVGSNALDSNVIGDCSVAVGQNALTSTTRGCQTAVGASALSANTTGLCNTAVGYLTLAANTTGCRNTAVGFSAGCTMTTGRSNTLVGTNSGLRITSGGGNVGVGVDTLCSITIGNSNVAVGCSAGTAITSGCGNVAVGCYAAFSLTTGFRNTIVGNSTGTALDTGLYNTLLGAGAGNALTSEFNNVIIGGNDGSELVGCSSHVMLSDGSQNVAALWNNDGALSAGFCASGGVPSFGTTGQVLTSQGTTAPPIWAAGGGSGTVTSVAGTAPIAITGVSTVTPTVCIAPASTTACGAVQLYDGVNSTSTALALTAAQGKALQDQITALTNVSNLVLAGTLDASTGLVDTVTSAGVTAGYAIGSAIPAATVGTVNTYVIVTEPGTVTPPGGVATAATRGDWFIVAETAPATYAWEFLNVGFDAPSATTTVAGIVCLSTNALAQGGINTTTALTPAAAASAYIPLTCATGKGVLISATAANTPVALPVGADGLFLTADSTCATGLKWAAAGGGSSAATPIALGTVLGCTVAGCTSLGCNALLINTGTQNVAIGGNSLRLNTTGSDNTAIGTASLFSNTTGCNNTSVGIGALGALTSGSCNIGIGVNAGNNFTTEIGNVVIGSSIGNSLDGCNCHVIIADGVTSHAKSLKVVWNDCAAFSPGGVANYGTAGQVLTSQGNTAPPIWAAGGGGGGGVTSVTAGTGLTGGTITTTGTIALDTTCVIQPTALLAKGDLISASAAATPEILTAGADGLVLTTDSTCTSGLKWAAGGGGGGAATPTALGTVLGCTVATNTALGCNAHLANPTGANNIAIGSSAGCSLTTGTSNIVIGAGAGVAITTGFQNTIIGCGAGTQLTSQGGNTVIGQGAFTRHNTTSNIAIGSGAMGGAGALVTAGGGNTGIGQNTLRSITTGCCNTVLGSAGGCALTTGFGNTFLGWQAGNAATTGNSNVVVKAAGTPAFNLTTESSRVVMGNTDVTNAYVKVAWTVTSDARDKIVEGPVPLALDFVEKLEPKAYRFRVNRDSDETTGPLRYGFLAQEVLALEGDSNVIIDNEQPDHLRYQGESLVPVLVNAIKELSAKNKELEQRLSQLENNS